ncbi:MAG: segregation/condensation protein A [Candidatus Cloacimonadales bacterium]|nr:segregation/condensation protein A [Defluviitoga tunisiensis]HHV01581.1 segregation/condensation protein A [Defluviitoga tunisiensis]HPU59785.1 segregation/condensation protein A [Defluviitoga tunisiensis]HQD43055.1 segregation/condensation protein A [Defluviitoga tunisiensis]
MVKERGTKVNFEEVSVQFDIFSGPFSKLVELVKEKKISVRQISVSVISDLFLDYVNTNYKDLNSIGEFLELASYLTFLKSREILPNSSKDKDFKRQREFIYTTIENYDILKQAKDLIKEDFGENKRKAVKVKKTATLNSEDVGYQLVKFFDDYITNQKRLEIIKDDYNVEKAIKDLEKINRFNVYNLFEYANYNKLKFVVLFLAALVLVQHKIFDYKEGFFYRIET